MITAATAPTPRPAEALHAAVSAIYFADGSDYLSALWSVVRALAPELVDELEQHPAAVWARTQAALEQPFTEDRSPL